MTHISDSSTQSELSQPSSVMSFVIDDSALCSIPETTDTHTSPLLYQDTDKYTRKTIPELDNFAKKKKITDDKIDKHIQLASSAINKVADSFVQQCGQSGYGMVFDEKMKCIKEENKIDCFIEVLNVLKKYEKSEYIHIQSIS